MCWVGYPLCSVSVLESQALTTAVDNTGDTYNQIGQLFEQQVSLSISTDSANSLKEPA